MRSSTAKYLSQEQIYEILRLYSKCKLPVHPVAGMMKEKEYYITGAQVDRIKWLFEQSSHQYVIIMITGVGYDLPERTGEHVNS